MPANYAAFFLDRFRGHAHQFLYDVSLELSCDINLVTNTHSKPSASVRLDSSMRFAAPNSSWMPFDYAVFFLDRFGGQAHCPHSATVSVPICDGNARFLQFLYDVSLGLSCDINSVRNTS